MTLQEFFEYLTNNPANIIFYFAIIPFAALLAGWLGKGEGHLSPWKYLYATLVYMACVPGILAVALNVYLFLFEKQSIFDADIFTQILPILSMMLTIIIIRRNVDLDDVPGFEKLSGLIMMISAVLIIMFFLDRTRIYIFSYLPLGNAIIAFIVLLLVIRFGWRRLSGA